MLDLHKKYYAVEKQKKGKSYYEILIMKIFLGHIVKVDNIVIK